MKKKKSSLREKLLKKKKLLNKLRPQIARENQLKNYYGEKILN